MPRKDTYCSFCGQPFAENQTWPRHCKACGQMTFRNPIPVAVVLQPVDDGLLLIRRDIEPGKGKLALPGGFIDFGETWQVACARELYEETQLTIEPDAVTLFDSHSTPDGKNILIFGRAAPLFSSDLPPFTPTHETSERCIITTPTELAFPLHTQMARKFFDQ